MTIRAIVAGLALGLFISAFTHFNDLFIRGTLFINHHLPMAVFGLLVLVLLTLNPLLRLFGQRVALSGGEVAIIAALGLAACGWPSFGFYRYFITIPAMPGHLQNTRAHWQSANVMSYVPGGSPLLAEGHVQDWDALAAALLDPQRRADEPVLERLWRAMSANGRWHLEQQAEAVVSLDARRDVLLAINEALASGDLTPQPPPDLATLRSPLRELVAAHRDEPAQGRALIRLNRWWLVATLPEVVLPPPRGGSVLLAGGQADTPALTLVHQGSDEPIGLANLPWDTWWPTVRIWGTLGLLLAVAALCLVLIVHPQWSRRELLPYPIARFANELLARDATSAWPNIARRSPFWLGMGAMMALHGINGLHAWFPAMPHLPLQLNFEPLTELFPNFAQVHSADRLFKPILYFSAIAFCFFLPTSVSFSLGTATIAYGLLGSVLLGYGIALQADYIGAGEGNLLRFGAYVGMAGIILYVGRYYYANIITASLGFARASGTSLTAVWAMRGLVVVFALSVAVLHDADLDWLMASLLVVLVLLTLLVLTRIVVEIGMFFVQAWWLPVGMLTALMGFEAIGPTTYILLAMGSTLLVGDPRTTLMPYLANALQIVDRSGAAPVSRVTPWLIVMMLAGFIVAGAAVFSLTHNHGTATFGPWETITLPGMPFETVSTHIANSRAQDTLSQATAVTGLDRIGAVRIDGAAYAWVLLGLGLLLLTAAARLRLAWWPIHPVLFLVWGTMPASRMAMSFLIGWLIKLAVMHLAGARGYRSALPLMVGIIAGELLSGLLWAAVGAAYYALTGLPPAQYRI